MLWNLLGSGRKKSEISHKQYFNEGLTLIFWNWRLRPVSLPQTHKQKL